MSRQQSVNEVVGEREMNQVKLNIRLLFPMWERPLESNPAA